MVRAITRRLYDEQQLRAVVEPHPKEEGVAFSAYCLVHDLVWIRESLQEEAIGYTEPESCVVLAEAALLRFVDAQLFHDRNATSWTLR